MISLRATQYLKHFSALVFFLGLILVGFFAKEVFADNALQYKAEGYAYGAIDDNGDSQAETGIGYISFGCEGDVGNACGATSTSSFPTGYGVRINTNPDSPDEGKFYGYAWSSNYGWVSFFHNDVSSCGAGGGLEIPGDVQDFIQSSGNSVVLDGWARVLNYDSNEWDGCVRFAGSDVFGQGSQYQSSLTVESSQIIRLGGWAYGGNLVGWISFDCANCGVTFSPIDEVEEGCEDVDDPESCLDENDDPFGTQSGIVLFVGEVSTPLPNLSPTTSIILNYEGDGSQVSVKLAPDALSFDVDSCVASYASSGNGLASGWSGNLTQSSMNPLIAGDYPNVSNQFLVQLTNYTGDELYQFKLDCLTVDGGQAVSASAFVTVTYPSASVSITANPGSVDVGGGSTVSWSADFVEGESCVITGAYDTVPNPQEGEVDPALIDMDAGYAASIGFGSLGSVGDFGSDDVVNLQFPTAFVLKCLDYQGNLVQDSTIIGVGDFQCTASFEEAGYCSGDIAPIFEEF